MKYRYTKSRKAQTGCLVSASRKCPTRGRCQSRAFKHTRCGR